MCNFRRRVWISHSGILSYVCQIETAWSFSCGAAFNDCHLLTNFFSTLAFLTFQFFSNRKHLSTARISCFGVFHLIIFFNDNFKCIEQKKCFSMRKSTRSFFIWEKLMNEQCFIFLVAAPKDFFSYFYTCMWIIWKFH